MGKSKLKPKYTLMEAIGFTDADLEMNRAGVLSEKQRKLLIESKQNQIFRIQIVIVTAGVISVLPLGIFSWFRDSTAGWILGVILAVSVIVIIGLLSKSRAFAAELRQGNVLAVEGLVKLDVVNHGEGGPEYVISIQNETFGVSEKILLAFKGGDPYRIYYAPHSKIILSAEWLREE